MATQQIAITTDDERRTFASMDTEGNTSTYRLAVIHIYGDGKVWAWAEQMTKKGQPFKNGMGLTMGDTRDMAEFYGQDVADVVAEVLAKIETDRKLNELAARGQSILDAEGLTVTEHWAAKVTASQSNLNVCEHGYRFENGLCPILTESLPRS